MEKSSFIKDRKKIVIWCIFAYAIVVNVYLYVHILDNFPHLLNDLEMTYLLVSANLYKYGAYSFCMSIDCLPTLKILPVFTYIGFLVFSVFGLEEMAIEVIRIILILSNLGIVFISYRIGSLFNYKVGCVAAFLAASDLSMFCWANNFRPDMLYAFLFTLFLFFLIKFIKVTQSKKNIVLASLFLGLAALTKPGVYLLFGPLSVFLLFFLLIIKKIRITKGLYYICLFVIIQSIFIGGWKARNYFTEGSWVFCSQVGSTFIWHVAPLKAYQDGISFREAAGKLTEKYETEEVKKLDIDGRISYYNANLVKVILSSPIDYSVVVFKGLQFFLLGSSPPDFLFSSQRREELFEIAGIKLTYEKDILSKSPSLYFTRRVPSSVEYAGNSTSLPFLEKLLSKGFISYVLLWCFIKSHLLIIYTMALVSIFVIFTGKSNRCVLLVMLLISAYFIFTIGPIGSTRHRAINMPIYYFLGSYGLIWLGNVLQRFKKRRNWNEKA